MKFLHIIFYDKKFTISIVRFYNKFFHNEKHTILIINFNCSIIIKKELEIMNSKLLNIKFLNIKPYSLSDNIKLLTVIRNYDCVILHSLKLSILSQIFILFNKSMKKNKIAWIEWGGDLYDFPNNTDGLLKSYIKNKIGTIFRNKIDKFIAIFPPDINLFNKKFNLCNVKTFYAPYIGYPDKYKEIFCDTERKLSNVINKKEPLYIQIGHNAMTYLNHKEVLEALEHFSKENIKIILPLNYGAKGYFKYADEVEAYAKKIFGEKVICLKQFLPLNEYFDIIDKVSICIFNTQRQCALGNIHHMIFRNTKLFMPQDSVMFRYFNGRGVPIYSFDGIEKMDFKEFTSDVVIRDINNFNNYIEELTNYERKVALWKNIYDEIEKDCKK